VPCVDGDAAQLITRKLAANYLAFVQLASIRLWLRVNESRPNHWGFAPTFFLFASFSLVDRIE
jgi:hypothetical protein